MESGTGDLNVSERFVKYIHGGTDIMKMNESKTMAYRLLASYPAKFFQ